VEDEYADKLTPFSGVALLMLTDGGRFNNRKESNPAYRQARKFAGICAGIPKIELCFINQICGVSGITM
jgi:hypothetical protein